MATYKVLQDIEAEDHILGPLTLRQFIYALIAAFFLYLCFIAFTKHASFLLVVLLPPALFTGFFAYPFKQDQPTEVWALAKIRFLIKPHLRIWDQSGVKELVTVTIPKKELHIYTNGLSQTEVKSRLQILAGTIDSRGWAIKNVSGAVYGRPPIATSQVSDRLIDIDSFPQEVPNYNVNLSDDMLDERTSPVARAFDQLMTASAQTHRQNLIERLQPPSQVIAGSTAQKPPATSEPPADYWFMNQAGQPPGNNSYIDAQRTLPGSPSGSAATTPTWRQDAPNAGNQNSPPVAGNAQAADDSQRATSSPAPDPVILKLAGNNDLDVATLARQASKAKHFDDHEGEVVVSLR